MKTPAKDWREDFKAEFGIHFKDSSGELEFALEFIEELLAPDKHTIIDLNNKKNRV